MIISKNFLSLDSGGGDGEGDGGGDGDKNWKEKLISFYSDNQSHFFKETQIKFCLKEFYTFTKCYQNCEPVK